MRHAIRIPFGIVGICIVAACNNGSAPPPATGSSTGTTTSALTTPGSCEVATAWLYDISGSMDDEAPAGSGVTILDRLKTASSVVIPLVPDGKWNIGVTTFPNDQGLPAWGMDVLDATNRPGLLAAVNGLTAGGSTDMEAGLNYAGLLVSTDAGRPKVIVAFSDGEVCSLSGCTPLYNYADLLKDQLGVNIVTVGYQLVNPEDTQMATVASTNADGSPMFLNAGTATELHDFFADSLGALCESLDMSLDVTSQLQIGSGGDKTIQYTAQRYRGPDQTIRIGATGRFISAGGSIDIAPSAPPTWLITATTPSANGKLEVHAVPSMSGQYDATVTVKVDGSDIMLAAKTITIDVVQHELNLSFNSPVRWFAPDQEIQGTVRVDVPYATNTQLSWSFSVTDSATGDPIQNLTVPAPGATSVTTADPVFYHAFQMQRVGPVPSPVNISVTYTLGGMGIRDSINASNFSIPP